ncbi:hypothetical protein HPODL_05167 [Ogataea parapolymorpha DL-1]|uniref:Sedlin n=1 Tax=Ogataea parapolymorpha (strain ATCC 26012 / BCRC 20466 / JCM 22074 / NRRL Y-7560 / DL-1) TaxID=871575 RepID=W1QH30_OGAPD|nr:hypothetical protein HPODL_05167 [Ogataea parapolymorpha DL-1]ESX01352.1 hypothetical protein HPODL_05167 [Ogataea parapolymorpha DL-1]
MTILFVSLISRDNRPLYIQPFVAGSAADERTANELLKYNFLSHMSLDIFESPFAQPAPDPNTKKTYVLLFVQDGVYVFGHQTSTGLRIVVGATRAENELPDEGLNGVFADIQRAYLKLVCNPFKTIESENEEIENPRFDRQIKEAVARWENRSLST